VQEKNEHIPDRALLAEIANGSEASFSVLAHSIYKRLFPFTVSLVKSEAEADDVMQDLFLKIWLNRTTLTTLDNPFGWIYTVLSHTISNHLRTKIRHELKLNKVKTITTYHLEEELDARFTESLIDEAARLLPEKRKQVFLLNKKEGLSRKEIAERLHISENTVRNQLAEAIRFIRERLEHHGDLSIPILIIIAISLFL